MSRNETPSWLRSQTVNSQGYSKLWNPAITKRENCYSLIGKYSNRISGSWHSSFIFVFSPQFIWFIIFSIYSITYGFSRITKGSLEKINLRQLWFWYCARRSRSYYYVYEDVSPMWVTYLHIALPKKTRAYSTHIQKGYKLGQKEKTFLCLLWNRKFL